jgi:hypothetical protein
MKRQIIIATINLCSLTWAMEHKAEQKNKSQYDILEPCLKITRDQSIERKQAADSFFEKLPKNNQISPNQTSLSFKQSNLFIIHSNPAKL